MKLRIATRGSKLALAQCTLVARHIESSAPGVHVELVEVKTTGDKNQHTPQAERGDKKDWILELELAVLRGDADIAIHSGKDVPGDFEEGTELLPVLKRGNPFDAFIGKKIDDSGKRYTFEDAPVGAVIGTASLRRQAQILRLRPDLRVVEHRGNVPTRMEKLDCSDTLFGIVLACAGLERLGYQGLGEAFAPHLLMPAVNQGTLVCQFKKGNMELPTLLSTLVDRPTFAAWEAERACVSILKADCNSAVSIYAEISGTEVKLSSRVLTPDGKECIEEAGSALFDDAEALGKRVANSLISKGANDLLEKSRRIREKLLNGEI